MLIRAFRPEDRDEVIQLVLHCQNDGTRPLKTVTDQPELLSIKDLYQDRGGGFWVAEEKGNVVGSIGLMNFGNGNAVLKKFFVYERYRGTPHHLGRELFAVCRDFAIRQGFRVIYLDTPRNTDRAHRFYERAGFQLITRETIPFEYDYPYPDSDFFQLNLYP